MSSTFMMLVRRYDLTKLVRKLGGVGGSFVASHFVWLTTTPDYAHFWSRLYMTAPTITDVQAFEKMVSAWFALSYLVIEHAYSRFEITPQERRVATPPEKSPT
jgi:hypothetical protein